jgi:hypothetical protein
VRDGSATSPASCCGHYKLHTTQLKASAAPGTALTKSNLLNQSQSVHRTAKLGLNVEAEVRCWTAQKSKDRAPVHKLRLITRMRGNDEEHLSTYSFFGISDPDTAKTLSGVGATMTKQPSVCCTRGAPLATATAAQHRASCRVAHTSQMQTGGTNNKVGPTFSCCCVQGVAHKPRYRGGGDTIPL